MRRLIAGGVLLLLALLAVLPVMAGAAGEQNVYVLHVDAWQEIDPGLAQITKRTFDVAEHDPNAVAVAILVDTPGGLVTSAFEMKDRILGSKLKTVAFVQGGAISAGALVASAAEKLYMKPGATIGAAEPRLAGSTESADYKTVSVVAETFRATALARGRDPGLAQAMVDRSAKVPGQRTELLVMPADEAVAKKYADGQATDLDAALKQAGITGYKLIDVQPTFSEQAGRFLTLPWVAILLLVVGVVAIGLEFMKPGLTLPGTLGVICLGLFFLGNVLVGTAGWLELSLMLIGIVLLVIEAFIPGFGVFGAGGILAVAASIFLAVPSRQLAISYLMYTAVAGIVALGGIVRGISRRGLGKALTLEHDSKGYVPARADLSGLLAQEGEAVTVLRPAGMARFGDRKVDVVTEGEYLPAGTLIKVIRVDGTRVIVRSKMEA
jgi:membrane-bound serine protease (ClpP class)